MAWLPEVSVTPVSLIVPSLLLKREERQCPAEGYSVQLRSESALVLPLTIRNGQLRESVRMEPDCLPAVLVWRRGREDLLQSPRALPVHWKCLSPE